MLFRLAWRNIWRNKLRSSVVIIAIALGLIAGIFSSSFVEGLMRQKINSIVDLEMSHFQVHHPKFRNEFLPKYSIPNRIEVEAALDSSSAVENYASRVIIMTMMASANHTSGMKIVGINPDMEKMITPLHKYVLEGGYLTGIKRNPILVSSRTAEKYKLKLRSKVVLTFQDVNNNMVSGAFRVAGIFNTRNGMYDESNAFVKLEDLQKLAGLENATHEIAVRIKDDADAELIAGKFQDLFEKTEILPWMDLATGMRFVIEMMGTYTMVIVGIIMVALVFSIINTMLMAVLERTREIGMLMAIGMNKLKIFFMIMIESIYLCLVGGPLGLLMSYGLISYFGKYGIKLGKNAGQMYEDMGFESIVYTDLSLQSYIQVSIMIIVMAVLASIYPARKALKLNPIEAIRKI